MLYELPVGNMLHEPQLATVFKKGATSEIINYTPISLRSSCILMEYLINYELLRSVSKRPYSLMMKQGRCNSCDSSIRKLFKPLCYKFKLELQTSNSRDIGEYSHAHYKYKFLQILALYYYFYHNSCFTFGKNLTLNLK